MSDWLDCPFCGQGHITYVVGIHERPLQAGKGRCDVCGYDGSPSDHPVIDPDHWMCSKCGQVIDQRIGSVEHDKVCPARAQ